jgi:hypothetical protein
MSKLFILCSIHSSAHSLLNAIRKEKGTSNRSVPVPVLSY